VLKLGIPLIAIAFLVGCTTSREDALIQSYQQKVDYHKQLQKTEKIQLFENNVTTIMLTATYLYRPNFNKNDSRDEEFIIGIHFEDEGVVNIVNMMGLRDKNETMTIDDKNNTTVPNYGLTLNKKKAMKITELNKNDERLKNIAYITEWGSYYLVTFKHTDSKQFSLVFESKKYGKGTFSFAKVAKYIYTKEGF